MRQETWNAVDRYFAQLLAKPDAAVEDALAKSLEAGLPAISVTANIGKLLQLLARMVGANRILEIGTLGGYSTIWLARALPPGGQLITLEIDQERAEVAASNFAAADVSEIVDLRVGPAQETLPQLETEGSGPFDFVFIDADKASLPEYFEWAVKLSRPGAVIVSDNVVRDGAVVDSSSDDPNVCGVRRFLELAAADPRVSSTAIQTVGEKGYDGFAIALVDA